jgi:hypothetical protein
METARKPPLPKSFSGGRPKFDKNEQTSDKLSWIITYLNPMDIETTGSFGS